MLGLMLSKGEGGLKRNDEVALVWWERAAENGDAVAMYRLARAYSEGRGVGEPDDRKALYWMRRA
eukprot:CAMPEP_0198343732 /NCGR_PEP_ID=MMETSP1450-20131203/62272_1 /TAXON_ID=753684 ORGANISM="Madagascaria erythrocladiodes, Strain CCMP3234" /NCGR_SAMPLE_ID=MMETSP1450 /ASSEMBLY_ACC=CAM_ASM_001115 /LENGTH=64 /DNA_ID=CAMNT_0044048933 /DNA_START=1 /DNA_END=191 /DNA_ORIENTATION=-